MTADNSGLVGRRVLVVGASAGIGRVIGETLCDAGAHVAFASRRKDVCEAAAKEARGTAIGLECDATDEAQCQRVVDESRRRSRGSRRRRLHRRRHLARGAGRSGRRLVAADVRDQRHGRRRSSPRAALPHLQQSKGSVVYLSSVASIGAAWPGLGVYSSTKAALNRMIEVWRTEHPEVGFTRVLVGPTDEAGTGTQFDPSAFRAHGALAGDGGPVRRLVLPRRRRLPPYGWCSATTRGSPTSRCNRRTAPCPGASKSRLCRADLSVARRAQPAAAESRERTGVVSARFRARDRALHARRR